MGTGLTLSKEEYEFLCQCKSENVRIDDDGISMIGLKMVHADCIMTFSAVQGWYQITPIGRAALAAYEAQSEPTLLDTMLNRDTLAAQMHDPATVDQSHNATTYLKERTEALEALLEG